MQKPIIPETPVVAVDTSVRLEAEVSEGSRRCLYLRTELRAHCLRVMVYPAQSHFVIHDADKSGTLDLYQMVLALQDGACGLWLAVLWDSCQTNHLPSLTPHIMSLCSWLYVLLWNV